MPPARGGYLFFLGEGVPKGAGRVATRLGLDVVGAPDVRADAAPGL